MKEILLYGEFGWDIVGQDIARQFNEARGQEVLLRIHSPGGSVFEGLAVLAAIRNHDAAVSARIEGVALSMAAVVALEVKDSLSMPEDGLLMFHSVHAGAGGNEDELRTTLELVEKLNAGLVARLSAAMGWGEDETREALMREIWLTGAEAQAAGLVAELTPAKALAAHVRPDLFKNAPKSLTSNLDNLDLLDEVEGMKWITSLTNWVRGNDAEDAPPAFEGGEINAEDLTASLAEVRKDFDELKASHAAELQAKAAKLEESEKQVEELTARADELEAKAEADAKAHSEALAAKDAEIEAANNSAEEKANAILAEAGHEPLETLEAKVAREEVIKQYKSLPSGPQRAKFRNEHREELADVIR